MITGNTVCFVFSLAEEKIKSPFAGCSRQTIQGATANSQDTLTVRNHGAFSIPNYLIFFSMQSARRTNGRSLLLRANGSSRLQPTFLVFLPTVTGKNTSSALMHGCGNRIFYFSTPTMEWRSKAFREEAGVHTSTCIGARRFTSLDRVTPSLFINTTRGWREKDLLY